MWKFHLILNCSQKTFATENVNVIFVIFSSWKFSIVCSESFWKVCWLWQLLCHLLQVDRQAVNLPPPQHSWYANLISNQMQQFLELRRLYVLTWLAFYLSILFSKVMYRQSVLNLLLKLNGYSLKTGFSIGFGVWTKDYYRCIFENSIATDQIFRFEKKLLKWTGANCRLKNYESQVG